MIFVTVFSCINIFICTLFCMCRYYVFIMNFSLLEWKKKLCNRMVLQPLLQRKTKSKLTYQTAEFQLVQTIIGRRLNRMLSTFHVALFWFHTPRYEKQQNAPKQDKKYRRSNPNVRVQSVIRQCLWCRHGRFFCCLGNIGIGEVKVAHVAQTAAEFCVIFHFKRFAIGDALRMFTGVCFSRSYPTTWNK